MARTESDAGIIVLETFIQATRDSGYKSTTSALAELVDNSIQAGAKHVWIEITQTDLEENPITVAVQDDGSGMDRKVLRQSLRFGGTSRFNDRSGLGRYGMGLPNASLSQSRRVEVYTWRHPDATLYSYLDVNEIATGKMIHVPEPAQKKAPFVVKPRKNSSGTLVLWNECDRLSHARVSTIIRRLERDLGQVFRHLLWKGVAIEVNGKPVQPIDPLFLNGPAAVRDTSVFGEPIEYEVAAGSSKQGRSIGKVKVTFVELPVHDLHCLSNEEKRQRGISNGAGVSIVRGGREVDYGWFFMGSKRRENYDDWWRCEVSFDPVLDEAFGITHTKQQVRPTEQLLEMLVPDMEGIAKVLNARVRTAHQQLKGAASTQVAEETAAKRESLLEPLPRPPKNGSSATLKTLLQQVPSLKADISAPAKGVAYKIVEANLKDEPFYSVLRSGEHFIHVVNTEHPFSRRIYQPLGALETPEGRQLKTHVDLLILAAARAEAAISKSADQRVVADFRNRWSAILATFLNR